MAREYDGPPSNGLRVSRRLEGTRLIDRESTFIASDCQKRPDPAGRLHALVGPPMRHVCVSDAINGRFLFCDNAPYLGMFVKHPVRSDIT